MSKLRTSILVILVIVSTISCLCVQLLIGVQTTLLNPKYYSSLMQKHDMYDLPQNYVLLSIKNSSNDLLSEPVCNALSPTINTAFSTDWAEYQGDKLINNTIEYLKGNQNDLQLEIPLKDRKVILKGEIVNYLDAKYSPQDLASFKIDSTEHIADLIVSSINLPDSINMAEVLKIDENSDSQIVQDFRSYYKVTSFSSYILLFASIFLLFFLGRGGLGLKWAGYSILMAGFITTLFTSASLVFIDDVILTNITKQNDLLMSIGTNPLIIVTIIKNTVMSTLNKIALISCMVGIVSILGSKLWRRQSKKLIDHPVS